MNTLSLAWEHWSHLLNRLQLDQQNPYYRILYQGIVSTYTGQCRHFRNLTHIVSMLTEGHEFSMGEPLPPEVNLAIWTHDLVWNPERDDNVIRSASLGAKIGQNLEIIGDQCLYMQGCIFATAHTLIAEDYYEKLVADLDLAILGKRREYFCRYIMEVQAEYGTEATQKLFYRRLMFAKTLLLRPSIYYHDFFQDRYEAQARANLTELVAQSETVLAN